MTARLAYLPATGPIGAEGPYWDGLIAGHLLLPRCTECGTWHWPAVWRCGQCGSWEQEWLERDLSGDVFSYTRTHHRFAGTEHFALPFVTALVTLSGTPVRLTGVVEGNETGLRIGASMTGRIDRTAFGTVQIPAIRWKLTA